jgi:hypothetical protein
VYQLQTTKPGENYSHWGCVNFVWLGKGQPMNKKNNVRKNPGQAVAAELTSVDLDNMTKY